MPPLRERSEEPFMASDRTRKWSSDFFSLRPRRRTVNYLLDPSRQLRVPLYALTITLAFGGAWLFSVRRAFAEFYSTLLASQPDYLEAVLRSQASDLALLTGLLGLAYVCTLLGGAIVISHGAVGPEVRLRRHVDCLKRGEYAARFSLRRGDAFQALAADLNELAAILEERDQKDTLER
jgi:hypothetical protein